MIIRYLQGGYTTTDLIIVALVMLVALVFHNVLQAYVASRYGDANPRFAGYMSFDLQRQLEPTGVLFLFLLGFGWPQTIPSTHATTAGGAVRRRSCGTAGRSPTSSSRSFRR